MARIVIKERVFTPTGNDLGEFTSTDFDTVEMQYKESDVVQENEGDDFGVNKKNNVPKPKDPNSIKPSFNDFDPGEDTNDGGGSGSGNNEPKPDEPSETELSEPDIESEDFSKEENSGGEGGGLSVDSGMGDDSDTNVPQGNEESDSSDDNGSNNSGNTGNFGDEDEEDSENSNGSNSGGSDGESEDSEEFDDSDNVGSNGFDGSQSGDESEDGDSSGSDSNSGEDSSGGNSQENNGEEGSDEAESKDQNNKSKNSRGKGESDTSGDEGDLQEPDGSVQDGDWDDEEDLVEHKKSGMESLLDEIEDNKSDLEKMRDSKYKENEDEENPKNKNTPQKPNQKPEPPSQEETRTVKQMIDDAIKNSEGRSDEELEQMNELFEKLGAQTISSLVNPKAKGDWKHQLDKIFDQATGREIIMNPNLVNKRIEDAPPGREDDSNQITHIAVLIDQSGSMGAKKFKTAISHVDTMLSVRKLGSVKFHIVGFSDWNLKKTAGTYRVVRGSLLKKTLMAEYSAAYNGTNLTEAMEVIATKVKKVDAIMIFTDAEIWDSGRFNNNSTVMSYVRRNRKKIVWVLTQQPGEGKQKQKIKEFTPYSVKAKLYVRFKKGDMD